MPSNAEQFYNKISLPEYGYDFVASLIERGMAENEWLEFKSADKIDEKNAVHHWSKALSGFANTGGGVLIWGILANKNKETGIDCANALALVPDPKLFAQKLNDVLLEAVIPALNGVQITPITKQGQREGFVVCLIPEGMHKAHRAELVENKPFYMRNRDKFFVPAVSVIRHLFYPQASASLQPRVQVRAGTEPHTTDYWFYLRNVGTRTAKDVLVVLTHDVLFGDQTTLHSGEATSADDKMPYRLRVRENLHPFIEEKCIMGMRIPDVSRYYHGLCFYLQTTSEDGSLEEWKCKLNRNHIYFEESYNFQPHKSEPEKRKS